MRGDPGALPAVWDLGNMGYQADYMSGDLLLTFQRSSKFHKQGNLEMTMRILINSVGAMWAYIS